MTSLNTTLARLVDGLLWPFAGLPPLVGITVASCLVAVAMLAVLRLTSDQPRLRQAKRAIHACWFEVRLFNDDLPAMWRAVAEMIGHHLRYVWGLAVPIALMSVPLALVVGQLQSHYGYGGLEVGQQAVVTMRLKGSPDGANDAALPDPVLTVPAGLVLETPAVWTPSLREAAWRITASDPGDYDVVVRVGDQQVNKRVRVSSRVGRRSPVRPNGSVVQQFLHPAESPVPEDSDVESMAVTYPRQEIDVLGGRVHWLIVFVVFTMGWALALRRPFRVAL